jgi:hypothetical protein
MIIYMEQTIALINGLPEGELRESWMEHLNGRLEQVFKGDISYYKFIDR